MVAESYGRRRIAAIAEEAEPSDVSGGQDLLADVDLATLDEATVAALYEELQQQDLSDGELDFPNGQQTSESDSAVLSPIELVPLKK